MLLNSLNGFVFLMRFDVSLNEFQEHYATSSIFKKWIQIQRKYDIFISKVNQFQWISAKFQKFLMQLIVYFLVL